MIKEKLEKVCEIISQKIEALKSENITYAKLHIQSNNEEEQKSYKEQYVTNRKVIDAYVECRNYIIQVKNQ